MTYHPLHCKCSSAELLLHCARQTAELTRDACRIGFDKSKHTASQLVLSYGFNISIKHQLV